MRAPVLTVLLVSTLLAVSRAENGDESCLRGLLSKPKMTKLGLSQLACARYLFDEDDGNDHTGVTDSSGDDDDDDGLAGNVPPVGSGVNQTGLAERRAKYPVSFDTLVKDIAMLGTFPPLSEFPGFDWALGVFNRVRELVKSYGKDKDDVAPEDDEKHTPLENAVVHLEQFLDEQKQSIEQKFLLRLLNLVVAKIQTRKNETTTAPSRKLLKTLGCIANKLFNTFLEKKMLIEDPQQRPMSVQAYNNLFATFRPVPESQGELPFDQAFARYRLSGYVPAMLRKATQTLLDEMHFSQYSGPSDTLVARVTKALADGRLYAVDYGFFQNLARGEGKFIATPVALFEIPRKRATRDREGLLTLCVQIVKGQATSIFTSADKGWTWKYAKLVFNQVESNYHEGIAHLGETHLVVEAMCLSVKRSFLEDHPIHKLMHPHLVGTLLINYLADKTLIVDGGAVDRLLSPSIQSVRLLVSQKVLEKLSTDLTFPALMKSYGLDEDSFRTTYYPYREFGYRLWDSLHRFVKRYIKSFYATDAALNQDPYIEVFRQELVSNKVVWVQNNWAKGGATIKFLTNVLAAFIFHGSVQHAAVNFAQGTTMASVNTVPLGLYSEPATKAADAATETQVLYSMPTNELAYLQRDTLMILSVQYTSLVGSYADTQFEGAAKVAADKFWNELKTLEDVMKHRNAEWVAMWGSVPDINQELVGHWAYNLLLPSAIPMSINI